MARVNVETRALAETRFFNLAQALEMTRAEAIGTLVIFWHDTQERGVWKAPRDALLKFIPYSPERRDEVLAALIEHEYVSECEDGELVVHGNRKHIDALEERKAAASEGGKAKARKAKENKPILAHGREPLAPAKSALPNALQSNALQSSTKQKEEDKSPSASALPRLAEIWNRERSGLPEVRGCSGTRRRQAETRWREKPDPDYWSGIVRRIATSPFCRGENDRGWRADFDFFIRPETHHRVTEGKYDARSGPAAALPKLKSADDLEFDRLMAAQEAERRARLEGLR